MSSINPMIMDKYNAVINLCQQSRAYYRHTFCGTRNGSQYLKIVTKKGAYFSPLELQILDAFVTQLAGQYKAVSFNRETGTVSVTFYDPATMTQTQTSARRPDSSGQGRIVRR